MQSRIPIPSFTLLRLGSTSEVTQFPMRSHFRAVEVSLRQGRFCGHRPGQGHRSPILGTGSRQESGPPLTNPGGLAGLVPGEDVAWMELQ